MTQIDSARGLLISTAASLVSTLLNAPPLHAQDACGGVSRPAAYAYIQEPTLFNRGGDRRVARIAVQDHRDTAFFSMAPTVLLLHIAP
jgi:hypothetical protein